MASECCTKFSVPLKGKSFPLNCDFSRIRKSDSAESDVWKHLVVIANMYNHRYTFRESHVSKWVKDFYDQPLETRFVAVLSAVLFRFVEEGLQFSVRFRHIARQPPWRNCGREHSRVFFMTVNDVKRMVDERSAVNEVSYAFPSSPTDVVVRDI